MQLDSYGQSYATVDDIAELIYQHPALKIDAIQVSDPSEYNNSVQELHANMPVLKQYTKLSQSLDDFDKEMQSHCHIPQQYKDFDIAEWVLSRCTEDYQLQRVGEELLLYQERDLFNLLRYIKYLVDTMRKNNIVWGVGRGSSTASYVLYLIGIHKIDALLYGLDPHEFLK